MSRLLGKKPWVDRVGGAPGRSNTCEKEARKRKMGGKYFRKVLRKSQRELMRCLGNGGLLEASLVGRNGWALAALLC